MHLTLTATSEDQGQRIDAWLAAHAEGVTRSAAARLLENGGVTVNGEPAAKNYRLRGVIPIRCWGYPVRQQTMK